MNSNSIDVGKRIFDARKEKNMTREKLAELSDISVQFLADIEKGRKSMTINTLKKICDSLNLSADYIINGEPRGKYDIIVSLLDKLTDDETKQAEKLLEVFVEALNNKTDTKKR